MATAWTITDWTSAYQGGLSPLTAMAELAARCVAAEPDWILCLDAAALQAQIAEPAVKDALKATTEEAVKRGVFGAPTCFVGGEMFFGQDRLDFVRGALRG